MAILKRFCASVSAAMICLLTAPHAQANVDQRDTIPYRVKKGDTLIGFSTQYLKTASDFRKIAAANGKRDADKLRPGEQLNIPVQLLKSKPIEARIVAFTGAVTVTAGKRIQNAQIGMPLYEGESIETGDNGFLTLSISTGARVSMPSRSKVRILRLRRYDLNGGADLDFAVDQGRTETSVTPFRDSTSRFRMRTPVAVSAVRGTSFRIGYDGEAAPSLTEVVEGAVGVASVTTGNNSEVPHGFGVAAKLSGSLDQEKLLPPPAMIEPGRLQQDANLRFDIKANPAATGHHVQLSRDAGFVDIFAAKRSPDASIEFSGVPDGVYFVRAMAIAKSGLEGLTETYSFKRQLTELAASRSSQNPDEFLFSWIGQGSAKQLYRFQLFNGDDRAIPLIDEPGLQGESITLVRLKPAIYSWRVGTRSFSGGNEEMVWTPLQKLTISE
jgi:hypothetical protein